MNRTPWLATLLLLAVPSVAAAEPVQLVPIGRTAPAGETGAEIAAFHAKSRRMFVTNADQNSLDVYDASNPAAPPLVRRVDLSPYGGGPNSVDVSSKGLVAVAVEAEDKTQPGSVQFFDAAGNHLGAAPAGALPDMLTFTHDERRVVVANEGEPNDAYTVDPEGSVTIIDLKRGLHRVSARNVRFHGVKLKGFVRIFGPNATVPQDLEPEYVAVSPDDGTAYVTLQENNAVGILDIDTGRWKVVRGLGFKDHSRTRNALDPSDEDGIEIATRRNVLGMYQPDAIAAYEDGRRLRLVTANEGDARDYDGFSEQVRASALELDPADFPPGSEADDQLGRLRVTNTLGDLDGDGRWDRLFAFGGRSMSVLDGDGEIVFDTGSELERFAAANDPASFNTDNTAGSDPDNRSDDKGPEPEGVDVGRVGRSTYAFLAAERQGGIYAYDLSDGRHGPRLSGYVNTREADLGPEGVRFVSAHDSPTRRPLVLVTNEISGTVLLLEVRRR
jgi:DNA-binding beta-propeller fold protein YncE